MCLVSSGQRSGSPSCFSAWPRSRVSMRSVRVAGGLIATTRTPWSTLFDPTVRVNAIRLALPIEPVT